MVDVRTVAILESSEEIVLTLDELAREGARRMIAAALQAEADEYVAVSDDVDEDGAWDLLRSPRLPVEEGLGLRNGWQAARSAALRVGR